MSPRSIVVGLVCVALFCSASYFNDHVLRQSHFAGNHLAPGVFAVLAVFLFGVNPLLAWLRPGWAFNGRELAVILVLLVAACGVPSAGLQRDFISKLVLPHSFAQKELAWKKWDIVNQAPDQLVADYEETDGRVLTQFLQGQQSGEAFGLGDIPWDGFDQTLAAWLPALLMLCLAGVGLALVLHRQWSHNEHLPYPLAEVIQSFLPDDQGKQSSLYRDRLFLYAFLAVFLLHFNNYLHAQFDLSVRVSRFFDLKPFTENLPSYYEPHLGFLQFNVYFAVVGVAYFLPRDISFSIGIGPAVLAFIVGTLTLYGFDLTGRHGGSVVNFMQLGSYLGLFLMLLYTGRHFYQGVLRAALLLRKTQPEEREAVFGARLFLVGITAWCIWLMSIGLDWPLVLIYTAMVFIIHVVMSRILAETGFFFVQPVIYPAILLTGLMGAQALGPQSVLLMLLVSAVIWVYDPRQAFMPYIVNGFKVLEHKGVSQAKVAPWTLVALAVGLFTGIPAALYFIYSGGIRNVNEWGSNTPVRRAYDATIDVSERLNAQGRLESAEAISGLERFLEISPQTPALTGFLAGLFLVLLFSWGRLRFRWWPIHPVMFATWTGYAIRVFAVPFLIGWFIKTVVLKYGGESLYTRLKPLMIGLIAGEIMGGVVPLVINAVYYLYFSGGQVPEAFRTLPG
ncbi:MAG: DUF6785 family protein [Opitutales bacterium]